MQFHWKFHVSEQGLISSKKVEEPENFSGLTFIQCFSFYTSSSFSKSWSSVLKVTSIIRLIKINEERDNTYLEFVFSAFIWYLT